MNREWIQVTKDIRFLGVNRENEYKSRPKFMVDFTSPGNQVNLSHNDGFYGAESGEPHFVIRNAYCESFGVPVSLSQLNDSMKGSGMRLVVEEVPDDEPVVLTEEQMYELSKKVGLEQFQPVRGGGKICSTCKFRKIRGECEKSEDEVTIERYNDGIEYCFESDA